METCGGKPEMVRTSAFFGSVTPKAFCQKRLKFSFPAPFSLVRFFLDETVSISEYLKEEKVFGEKPTRLISKIYSILYTSELLHFLLHETHKKLKAHGIILPGSQFDLMLKSYWKDDENWRQSKILLKEIIQYSKENNIQLIVYLFPEMDLLEHQDLFTKCKYQ